MRTGRRRGAGGTSAAATVLVAAAAALLATTPVQLGGLSQRDGTPTAGVSVPAVTSSVDAVAPAPPQSFSRPAREAGAYVPESPPVLLEAPRIGLRAAVTSWSDEQVAAHGGVVSPSSLWEVVWWAGGGTPGSHAGNTVYLYGHTWKGPAVFNRVKELRPGDSVVLTTRAGHLEYVVEQTFTVTKADLDEQPAVRDARPGRLLLIGCYRETGREESTTHNVVVAAQLK